MPRWAAKYATNAPKEEEPAVLDPEPEEAPEEEADTAPAETWKTRWSEPEPAWGLTAKERRDRRSQEIGQRKEAERAARKAKKRAEMGITESQLKQIIEEEFESMVDEGFWPWQTKQNKKKPSVMWTDPKTGKNYWLPPDDPRVKKDDKLDEAKLTPPYTAVLKSGKKVRITGKVKGSDEYLTKNSGRIISSEIDHAATSKLNKKEK